MIWVPVRGQQRANKQLARPSELTLLPMCDGVSNGNDRYRLSSRPINLSIMLAAVIRNVVSDDLLRMGASARL